MIDPLQNPTLRQQGMLRSLSRDFARFSREPRAPGWVRALARTFPTPPPALRAPPKTTTATSSPVGSAFVRQSQVRGIDPAYAREFARSNEWVRATVNKIKGRVSRAERGVVPLDPKKPYDPKMQLRLSDLIETPNFKLDSWRSFCEPWLEDLLCLGKGGFEHVENFLGWPLALLPIDTGWLKVIDSWDGTVPSKARYQWGAPHKPQVYLRNDEATIILLNPTTYRPEGISPIETLTATIEADAASNEFIRTMLKRYPPPGWLNLGRTANPKTVRSVSERLQTDVLGQGGLLVTGGLDNVTFQSLWAGNSRDNELMAWALYFARKVAVVYNLSPQDIGITADITRAQGTIQQEISTEDGFKTILLLVEEYINREIFGKFGGCRTLNLVFRFKELTLKDRLKQAEFLQKLVGDVPLLTLNEGRRELDLEPQDLGDAIFIQTSTGIDVLVGPDAVAYRALRLAERLAELQGETDITSAAAEAAAAAAAARAPTDPPAKEAQSAAGRDALPQLYRTERALRVALIRSLRDHAVLSSVAYARPVASLDAAACARACTHLRACYARPVTFDALFRGVVTAARSPSVRVPAAHAALLEADCADIARHYARLASTRLAAALTCACAAPDDLSVLVRRLSQLDLRVGDLLDDAAAAAADAYECYV